MLAGCSLFLIICLKLISAIAPWWDEGFVFGPPANLVTTGIFGSHTLSHMYLAGDRYLYWQMPLYFVILSGWFELLGEGITTLRGLSLICAFVALGSWYVIIMRLFNNTVTAALLVFLLCTDYVFVMAAVDGRMDMMTAAFGLAGLAAYVSLRETNIDIAILSGAAGAAAATFCHPLGLVYCGAVFVTSLWLDRTRMRPGHALLALAPFLVLGFAWAAYISKRPDVFISQMNTYSNRFHLSWNPVQLIHREVKGRYLMYYNGALSVSGSRLAKFKLLSLVPYGAGFLLAVSSRCLRATPNGRLLIALTPLVALLVAVGDVIQSPRYFLHVFTFPLALLAIAGNHFWRFRIARGPLLLLFAGAASGGLTGLSAKLFLDESSAIYAPVISTIQSSMREDTLVDGPCELIFGLGDKHLVDGMSPEEFRERRPDFVVIGKEFGNAKVYDRSLYELVYRNRKYEVYRAKPSQSSHSLEARIIKVERVSVLAHTSPR